MPHRFSLAIPSDIAVFRAEIVINTASSFLARVSPINYMLDVVKKSSRFYNNVIENCSV